MGRAPRFLSPDGSWAVWTATRQSATSAGETVTIKGAGLGRLEAGEALACRGRWREHPQHGWAFEVEAYRTDLPQSEEGVATWLTRRVDGIGPAFARAVVAHFGAARVFEALDEDSAKLREVRTAAGRRLPKKQVEKAIAGWDEVRALREVEAFLFAHGVSAGLAARLFRRYGAEVADILRTDPYRVSELRGVGFRTADAIARSLGVPSDDPARLQAGLLWVLEEAEGDGHVFLSREQLADRAARALELETLGEVDGHVERLVEAGRIVVEADPPGRPRVYARRLWEMERRLAAAVRELVAPPPKPLCPPPKRPQPPPGATPEQLAELRLPTDEQWRVVDEVRSGRLSILTGGPGVGKSQAVASLVEMARGAKLRVALCAPTGRAARRMTELTGHSASTIHRLLEFSPWERRFQRDEEDTLDGDFDLLVMDEASMLSIDLADAFFRAVGSCHVLLVGDTDQLPPVGAGSVLADLIATDVVPRVHLTQVFRQAARSLIVQNARRINAGELPWPSPEAAEAALGEEMRPDFFWIGRSEPARTAALAVELMTEHIPRKFGHDPVRDILMLAPMHRGVCGLEALNAELERRLNPGPDGTPKAPVTGNGIAVGSRVIQTVNSHVPGREIMNGELARVMDHSTEKDECLLSLDDGARELWVPLAEMASFAPAWAISVHKSQGSQAKAIVCVVSIAHRVMLARPLTYTAVTRAQELCVMVGEAPALRRAVSTERTGRRNSTLARRVLEPALAEGKPERGLEPLTHALQERCSTS